MFTDDFIGYFIAELRFAQIYFKKDRKRTMKQKFSLWQNLMRICRYRLVIPLLRSPHPPEYKARGVAIGTAWAMTPLVGIQMYLVFMTWIIAKKVFKFSFSLPLGLAYTWITNVFTMIPIYYGFYATGQWMLGRPVTGYESLKKTLETAFMTDYTFWEKWGAFFKMLVNDWGVAMAIGCIPWVIVFGPLSYYLVLKFEHARMIKRTQKQKGRNK